MLAAVLHGANDLRLEHVPEPVLPVGGLLIETTAVGICGSDVRNWRQGSPRLMGPQIVGHEVAGCVVASDSVELPVGTPVGVCPGIPCLRCSYCARGLGNLCPDRLVIGYDLPGGMAERFAVPAAAIAAGCVVPLPASVPLEIAPLAETIHTILNGQDRAAIGPGDRVIILGLGPVGVLHAAVAGQRGAARVLAVDPIGGRVDAAAGILGLDRVIRAEAGWQDRARAQTDGQGWDVVVVATAASTAFATAMEVVGRAGRILAFAGIAGATSVVDLDLKRLHYEQISVIGAFGGTPRTYARAVAWLADTTLPVERLVTARRPLGEALEAYAGVERGDGLKTMLRP